MSQLSIEYTLEKQVIFYQKFPWREMGSHWEFGSYVLVGYKQKD